MKHPTLQALAIRWALTALGALAGVPASAQIAIDEINPVRSSLHATNANGGSGGRIQSVAADPQDGNVYYAASEWGGLYKTADRGRTWDRLDNFLATAAGGHRVVQLRQVDRLGRGQCLRGPHRHRPAAHR